MRRSDLLGGVLGQKSGGAREFGGRGASGAGRLRILTGLLLSAVLLAGVQLAQPVQSSAIWG